MSSLAAAGFDLPPVGIALVIAILVISLGIHEAAHAWVADKCGDPTGRDLGRISLNPLVHIDPFLTVLLPTILFYSTGFVFGGAKPVPVNFHNLRSPMRDMALVALAGPISNILIALVLALGQKLVFELGIWGNDALGMTVLEYGVGLNLLLAAFNLLPIPPLDGSRVMAWLLPSSLRPPYIALERYGLIVLILLLYMGFLQSLIAPMLNTLFEITYEVVSLGGLW